jgi:RNA-binding protein Musashi
MAAQIDPKRAIPREEHLRNTRYFVGGLAPHTTAESMREFFSAYGKVVDATPMIDRESGRSKGFGFVTFEDASNTDQLVGHIGLILDDKQVGHAACVPSPFPELNDLFVCTDRSQDSSAT